MSKTKCDHRNNKDCKHVFDEDGIYIDPPLDTVRNDNLAEVIDERVNVYGKPEDMFPRMAQVWSGIIGHEVTAEQVALCMIGYKLVRASQTPDYSDNSDDVEGYLDIFRTLVGPDMVHARSVTEYLEAKHRA